LKKNYLCLIVPSKPKTMKKSVLMFCALVLALGVVLTSCGGGLKKEAEKAAKIQCDLEKLNKKLMENPEDEATQKEIEKLSKEMEDLGKQLQEKYGDDKEKKEEFRTHMKEFEKDCK
jgi:septal ring factor EnvC (AmiA/AmiB activator)